VKKGRRAQGNNRKAQGSRHKVQGAGPRVKAEDIKNRGQRDKGQCERYIEQSRQNQLAF
jgi:hypothetical protein